MRRGDRQYYPHDGTGFQIKDLSTGEFVTQDIYYPNPETLDTFYVSDEAG